MVRTVCFSEIKMQYELPKLDLNKTEVKVFELPQNVQLKALESEEWVSQRCVPPGLHACLFLQVNF